MKKNIDNIIETYGNMKTISPKPGFESAVREKIQLRLGKETYSFNFFLKPALLIVFLCLNLATLLTVFNETNGTVESSSEVTVLTVADDYNLLSTDSYINNYERIN